MLKGSPTSHIYFSQRLRLHYVDWGHENAPALLLIHGNRDHCRNWDWAAEALRDRYHVIAPDLRGHGDSQWTLGGGYSYADYVYDIAQLVKQIKANPVAIMGHSLGAVVSWLYAGLYPELVNKLVVVEGILPPLLHDSRYSLGHDTHEQLRHWVENLRGISGRMPRRYATLEDAFRRMQSENPHLSEEQARHLTIHGSNQNEDGTYSWKFDNYVRAHLPIGLDSDELWSLFERIECPILWIYGKESWLPNPDLDGRVHASKNVRMHGIANAGHWCHHDRFDEFIATVRNFLGE